MGVNALGLLLYMFSFLEDLFIFRVNSNGKGGLGKDVSQHFLVIKEEIAGGASQKNFYSAEAWGHLCAGELIDVVLGGADKEPKIGEGFFFGQRDFMIEGLDGGRWRRGVGHF